MQLFARHELAMYRETAAVTLHWVSADESMSKVEGKVVRAAVMAKPVLTGVCVAPDCENSWPAKHTSGCTTKRRGQASAVVSISGLCTACHQLSKRTGPRKASWR